MLTVFTPSYNRAYILPQLYQSLLSQTSMDFEWVIVDDGSTDGTDELVRKFEMFEEFEGVERFPVRYFKQENGGKHRAINRGVKEANGELFFIVDSDDYLTPDAVEWIANQWNEVKNSESERESHSKPFAGLSGIRITPDGKKIGGDTDFGTIDATSMEIREKYHVQGDLAEVFRTEVLREIPFPEYEGEKFCPEAMVWNKIAQKYNLRFVHHGIYVCDYLPDGLTSRIVKVRHQSPLASMTFYSELMGYEASVRLKLRAAINFWRFTPWRLLHKVNELRMLNLYSFCALPLGLVAKLNDWRNHNIS